MEILRALVAALGRAGGRARNKRGLTPLGEAVAAGHAAAAELLATQASLGLQRGSKGCSADERVSTCTSRLGAAHHTAAWLGRARVS